MREYAQLKMNPGACFNIWQNIYPNISESQTPKIDNEHFALKHNDVIKWKHFLRYWPFVRGIHQSPVNSPHKGQWRGAFMFSLIMSLNKQLSKQFICWWFETPLHSLWCRCNDLLAAGQQWCQGTWQNSEWWENCKDRNHALNDLWALLVLCIMQYQNDLKDSLD